MRASVTATLPRGDDPKAPLFAEWIAWIGNDEMTSTIWTSEPSYLVCPVCITNNHSVGAARGAVGAYQVARVGSTSGNGSGDVFVVLTTANRGGASAPQAALVTLVHRSASPLFDAAVQATEEAILSDMIAAETMLGRAGHRSEASRHDELRERIDRFGRLGKDAELRPYGGNAVATADSPRVLGASTAAASRRHGSDIILLIE